MLSGCGGLLIEVGGALGLMNLGTYFTGCMDIEETCQIRWLHVSTGFTVCEYGHQKLPPKIYVYGNDCRQVIVHLICDQSVKEAKVTTTGDSKQKYTYVSGW